jgi:dipeptidyl aminopeptidase/acylaminoacyl peptidase
LDSAPRSIPFETFLAVRSARGGAFSPDGRILAFLLDTSGVPQVYRLDSPAQEPAPLTALADIVRSVHWSPDGRWLLFTMDHGGDERHQLYLLAPDGSELRPLTRHPQAIHQFGDWSPDGHHIAFTANRRDARYFDVYVLDVESGEERCVLEQDGTFDVAAWTPDGQQLLLRQQHTSFNQDLHLLDLEDGTVRHVTPHEGEARYVTPRVLPDGRSVILCTDQGRDYLGLARLDLRSRHLCRLLERRADIESCDVTLDGRRLAALVNRDGWSELLVGRISDRSLTSVVSAPLQGVATDCRFAAGGGTIALSLNCPTRSYNVWSVDPATTHRVQWTHAPLGDLDPQVLVEPESVRYLSHDGLEIPALLYRPPGSGGGPAVVHVHGGPESQDRPNFSAVYQYLVHRGYTVLAPNVRGSTGYGNAYQHLDDREKRYDALRDVEYAHRWLAATGAADPGRIAIMGGSYGGFTVLACLTRQPERWAAGVDIVGISNFETFFENTGPWRRHLRASEYGDPVADAALLRDLSPIHAVDRIRAPLMVIQGANDPRVPRQESDQMVARLQELQQTVEYLVFDDEGHGIVQVLNRIRAYTAMGAFLDRHLRPGGE